MFRQSKPKSQQPKWLPPDCRTCQDIWCGLTSSSPGIKIDLGGRKARASTRCLVHKPLVEHLDKYKGTIAPRSFIMKGFADDSIRDAQGESRRSHWNLLVKKEGVADHPGVGHVLDPKWTDLGLAKRWKEECLSSHGARCSNPMKTWLARPAWLIDVEQGCLVEGQGVVGTYVALSYIYGRKTGCIVTAEILARLRRSGALTGLDPEVESEHVAPIVAHAMSLTSALGERYLWADSLCIPYQDSKAQAEQLSLMGSIYANAIFTVVSLSGDAIDGLPGIEGVSMPRKAHQTVVEFGEEQLVSHIPWREPDQEWNGHPYFDRGWTFQEYILSSRKLLFFGGQIHWICSHACWHEDMTISTKTVEPVEDVTSWPSVSWTTGSHREHDLSQTIQKYCMKNLRYDEDALPAISGTLGALSRFFPGGFLYGIPEVLFEWGLCWTPDNATAELRRRQPSPRPPESRLHPSELPSWSWVGWHGGIAMSSRLEEPILPLKPHPSHPVKCETLAITQWSTGASPRVAPAQRRRINSTFRRAPLVARRWRFTSAFRSKVMMPRDHGPESSTHPGPKLVPTTAVNEADVPFVPEQTPFLFCDTVRTQILGRLDYYNVVTLVNSSGKPVGYLHLHTQHESSLFPEDTNGAAFSVELVAVCKIRIHYSNDTILERYAVFWVEWKDGVAYRRASGEADAKEWDDSGPQFISLVLG
ncbi:heterokaryon incompatibility protein-domain-containing protein [Diaporthe sp. PMI_573]|nr:heterokaryon incompatibility protein-domain-containing protein [Diaporthaceae sp. PMI_573]